MPDQISVEIKGLDELQRKLTELSTTAADRAIRTALRAGATIEQTAIQERAPERPDLPSGTALPPGALANDIVIQFKKSDQGNQVAIVGPDKLTAHVARFVEEGHRLVLGKKLIGNVPAHPFIRPSFEASRDEVTEAIVTTLATEIEKASKQ